MSIPDKYLFFLFSLALVLFHNFPLRAQPKTDALLQEILNGNDNSIFREVKENPGRYRLQIIYTQINRNTKNQPEFTNYYFHYDPELYFNPASMVKMPLAFLSLEKLNELRGKKITRYSTILFDSTEPWHIPLYRDTTAASGLPSIAHFIKRAFLISENDPYNRMYQWVGQGNVNRRLAEKGYKDVRITRQFMGLTPAQNRVTNGIRFLGDKGELLYSQPPLTNKDSFDFSRKIEIGKAHFDSNDSLINEPFDFTEQNFLSLSDMQQILQSVLFSESVPAKQRFNLTAEDYSFLYRYLSQFPSETSDPKYDTSIFYDSYVKFYFRDSTHRMPADIRVFNKVGWSYGFLTDVSYVVDFKNKVEFMLAATLYVNSDEVLNDNKYEYDSVGHPFLYQLGQTIYAYELHRKQIHPPDLSKFKIKYEKREPGDKRPPLSEVDN